MPQCDSTGFVLDEVPWFADESFSRSIQLSQHSAFSALVAQEVERTIRETRHKKHASDRKEKWDGWHDNPGNVVPIRKVAVNA